MSRILAIIAGQWLGGATPVIVKSGKAAGQGSGGQRQRHYLARSAPGPPTVPTRITAAPFLPVSIRGTTRSVVRTPGRRTTGSADGPLVPELSSVSSGR